MSKLAVITRVSCAFLLVLIGLVVLPAAVQAKVNGGCTATGTASKSGAVNLTTATVWHVTAADVLTGEAKASSPQKVAQLKVVIFGVGLPLLDRTGNTTFGTAGPYRISDYDPYTRVLAVAGTSTSCDGSVLIIVDDVSPLTTWAGVLGTIAALLGVIGLLAGLTQVPSGNARVVGFLGLEPKSVGAAVDLVVDLNNCFPVRRHLFPSLSTDRRLNESACLPMTGHRKAPPYLFRLCEPEPGTIVAHHDLLSIRG